MKPESLEDRIKAIEEWILQWERAAHEVGEYFEVMVNEDMLRDRSKDN